ncbi:MAG: peptide ABC transporter permease, partial [Verrucomicrobia bacterium]|nr:peptide ABC transporter permease [Verrucomicrobiota bacterium]
MDDQSPLQQALRRFARNRSALWSAVFLAIGMSLVIGWPLLRIPAVSSLLPEALVQSADTLSDAQFHPPTWTHWFGTDVHGRDLLSRVMYGARVSILVGVVGAGVSLLIGVSW